MELSGIVPLPISVADNPAAAFLPLAGEAPLPRVVRTVLGAVAEPGRVIVAAAEPLVDDVRAVLASQDLPPVSIVAVDRIGVSGTTASVRRWNTFSGHRSRRAMCSSTTSHVRLRRPAFGTA